MLCLLLFCPPCNAQSKVNDHLTLLQDIGRRMEMGEAKAIRDLGSVYDEMPNQRESFRTLLEQYTIFTKKELNYANLNGKDILNLYYSNREKLKFSNLFNAFYITPLEKQAEELSVQLEENPIETDKQIAFQSLVQAYEKNPNAATIASIAALRMPNCESWLWKIIDDKRNSDNKESILQASLEGIANFPSQENFVKLLHLLKKNTYPSNLLYQALSKISNNAVPTGQTSLQVLKKYEHLLDSLHDMESIRQFGYLQENNTKPNYHQEPIDYFGTIYVQAKDQAHQAQNALIDGFNTQHPRMLYYLVASIFANKYASEADKKKVFDLIEQWSGVRVILSNEKRRDEMGLQQVKNQLIYWSAFADDYEWDESRGAFINKNIATSRSKSYDHFFSKLPSNDDTTAMNAFWQLANGAPDLIKPLAQKYRELMRFHNHHLPSHQFLYLENLSLLNDYCRKNNIRSKFLASEADTWSTLISADAIKVSGKDAWKDYNISLENVTAFEQWVLLHPHYKDMQYNASVLLNRFYAQHWQKIMTTPSQLRLYLKKAMCFKSIGISGICKTYLNKFENSQETSNKQLIESYKTERDTEIKTALLFLLWEKLPANIAKTKELLTYIAANPQADYKTLPTPNKKDWEHFFAYLIAEEDPLMFRLTMQFVQEKANIDIAPHLMALIKSNVPHKQKQAVEVLERVFDHKFEDANACLLWEQKAGNEYATWGKLLFDENLLRLEKMSEIDIEELNHLPLSSFYKEEYRARILALLKKVKNPQQVLQFRIQPALDFEKDYLPIAPANIDYRKIDQLGRLVSTDEASGLATYIFKVLEKNEEAARGFTYSRLLRQNWFEQYILSLPPENPMVGDVEKSLQAFLQESDLLNEFDQALIDGLLFQIANKKNPVLKKIAICVAANAEDTWKRNILQRLLREVTFEEWQTLLKMASQDSNLELATSKHFAQQLGLPLQENIPNLLAILKNNPTQEQVYFEYLTKIGVDFLNEKKQLDFEKIKDILQYDVVIPFSDGTGTFRSEYPLGIIKLLELHFNTSLGLDTKTSLAQTNIRQLANEWLLFLAKKNLHSPKHSPTNILKD